MAQKTIYKNLGAQRLVVDNEGGEETLWIADDLDGDQVNLSREELRDMMPAILGWLESE